MSAQSATRLYWEDPFIDALTKLKIVSRAAEAVGMIPSAIRLTSGLSDDSAEVQGVLTHSAISSADLAAGRFDGAAVQIGAVDWETLERAVVISRTSLPSRKRIQTH